MSVKSKYYNGIYDWRVVDKTISTASINFDLSNSNVFSVSLNQNTEIFLSNPLKGRYSFEVIQGGGFDITWPSNIKWVNGVPPTITQTANAKDLIYITYDGNEYYGDYAQDFYAPFLNQFSGAAAAYSLRNLNGDKNFNVVRVRRSSDNTESDFTAKEVEDGTLLSWVGANNGYVVVLYDQSGNGRNLTQATASYQGRVVSSGSIITDPDTGVASIIGTTSFGMSTSAFTLNQPVTKFTVANYLTTGSNQVLAGSTNSTARHQIAGIVTNGGEYATFAGVAFNPSDATTEGIFDNTKLAFFLFNTTNSAIGVNGAPAATGDAGTYTSADLTLGSAGAGGQSFRGYIMELIVYPSDKSADRAAIEAAINSHYNIY